MTSPSSRRADAVQGPQRAATGPEPSSGVGRAFHLDEPAPPLRSYLELGALPSAVPCARLHARHVLWEWGWNELAPDSELLVSELVTDAVQATAGYDQAAVRLRLSGDGAHVLIEVWDADPRPPTPKDLGEHSTPDPQEEGGRGLFLVAALSARWDWYPTREPAGKVVWCEVRALSPARRGVGEEAGTTVRSGKNPADGRCGGTVRQAGQPGPGGHLRPGSWRPFPPVWPSAAGRRVVRRRRPRGRAGGRSGKARQPQVRVWPSARTRRTSRWRPR
jgi:anti-sigma regulatory factor (Ser/Thr protein kinase)